MNNKFYSIVVVVLFIVLFGNTLSKLQKIEDPPKIPYNTEIYYEDEDEDSSILLTSFDCIPELQSLVFYCYSLFDYLKGVPKGEITSSMFEEDNNWWKQHGKYFMLSKETYNDDIQHTIGGHSLKHKNIRFYPKGGYSNGILKKGIYYLNVDEESENTKFIINSETIMIYENSFLILTEDKPYEIFSDTKLIFIRLNCNNYWFKLFKNRMDLN